MTIYQTRQLGIEFERRVQTVLPATESYQKLDTETIYSFLNQYQQKYVHDVYNKVDTAEQNTKLSSRMERILEALLKQETLTTVLERGDEMVNGRSITYAVPVDYAMYVRSTSKVDKTFNWTGSNGEYSILTNVLIGQQYAQKLIETSNNSLRILRQPVAVMSPNSKVNTSSIPTLTIIHDRYTNIIGANLLYYKMPRYFDIMTSVPCELPMDCFDDLVSGAVELYITYVRGGIRRQEEDGRMDRFNRRQAQREAEQNQE